MFVTVFSFSLFHAPPAPPSPGGLPGFCKHLQLFAPRRLTAAQRQLYNEEKTPLEDLPPLERQVIEAIGSSSVSTDDLAMSLAMPISELSGILFNLEVGGVICCEDGKYSRRKF